MVEYPTVPERMGQVPSLDKDPYSNDQNKMLRIYSTHSKGWLFWRTNTIVELLNLKLQSDRFFSLPYTLDTHQREEILWEQGELVKVRSLLKNGC